MQEFVIERTLHVRYLQDWYIILREPALSILKAIMESTNNKVSIKPKHDHHGVTRRAGECAWQLSYTGADVGRHWYRSSKGYDGQRRKRAGVTCVAGDGGRRPGRKQLSRVA